MFGHKTLNMVAGNGYVIPLSSADGSEPNVVVLMARAECYFKTANVNTTPTMPTSAAVPGAGLVTDYEHMLSGEVHTTGVDPAASPAANKLEQISHVLVWAVGSGNLVIVTS
jgi:hypothetical protein